MNGVRTRANPRGGTYAHRSLTTEERFWLKVDRSGGPDACWPWLGAMAGEYGRFDRTSAHRYALELSLGRSLTDDEQARHIVCDNPICANARHLAPGSHADNMADRRARGRAAFGARNARTTRPERTARGDRSGSRLHPESRPRGEAVTLSKLTPDAVREMRRMRTDGAVWRVIGERFGVSLQSARQAVIGGTWRHVE